LFSPKHVVLPPPDCGEASPQSAGVTRLRVELDDADFDGVFDEFGDVVEAEFFHDVGAVGLDGLDADVEAFGDLVVLEALGEELEDFAFARGERFVQ
jgi:hypothetical protein